MPAVQAELSKKNAQWEWHFRDLGVPAEDLPRYYYKSECLPLRKLRTFYLAGQKRQDYRITFREWVDLRDRARKDLYWLGHDCIATPESGSGFVEHVHREMLACFVQKNFDGVYHDDYTLDEIRVAIDSQDRLKELLLLAPTGSFKSTANKIDAVQWMLNCPDIRIFIITGSGALSRKFLKEVKGFFCLLEGQRHTFFQALFPEYVIGPDEAETNSPLFCPARQKAQPGTPTLWVNSIDGVIAGWHCDVWKADDPVNEDNSNKEDTRASLKARYDNIVANRPDKWAFKDQLGTRYFPDDWYGTRLEEMRKYPDTNHMVYFCRSAWTVKPEFAHLPIAKLQEHMVDLYFPEFMPFSLMIKKCRQNETNFRCQQLNEPAGGEVVVNFDQVTIDAHTIVLSAVPRPAEGERRPIIFWDTAHDDKVESDYCAGAAGWCNIPTRSLYVLEVRSGKWKDSVCAKQIVDMHWHWNAVFSEIEKFAAWELFAAEIQRYSLGRYRKYIPLLWRERDTSSGAKRNRVKGLETLLAGDRLWFVDGDWMELTIKQFIRFTGFSKRRKDDIPDAIAGLQRLIPADAPPPEENALESEEARKAREAQELKDKFAEQHAQLAYQTVFQIPAPVAPAQPQQAFTETNVTPAGPGWMFGKTGIHL